MNLYEIKKKNHKSEVYSLFYVQAIIFVSYYAIKLKKTTTIWSQKYNHPGDWPPTNTLKQ